MKENSIEEIIKQLELILKVRKEQKEIIECAGGSCMNCGPDIKALTESIKIVSDYKRVLKENELLRKDIEGWKKYCEEINEEQTKMSNKNCELEFDVEKLQKENEELKQENKNIKEANCYWSSRYCNIYNNSISKQKVKDKLEEIQKEYNKLDEQIDKYINDVNKDLSKYYENKEKIGEMQMLSYFIDNLQELIEEIEKN